MNDDAFISHNTICRLRGVLLEILDEFVRICEENNFIYFMIAGTLLGAVRHKGFIPWDDDIDIAMPRKDYEKFLDYFEKNDNSNYYLLSERSPVCTLYHYKPYAKICKKGTVFAEEYRDSNTYCGIFIDIFPFDNCLYPLLFFHKYLIHIAWRLYRLRTFYDKPKKKIKRYLNDKILCRYLPLKWAKLFLRNAYTLFNNYKTKYISSFAGIYGYKRETHKYNTIYPLQKILFEHKLYYAPCNCDLYLRKMYGNYLELPPIEMQKSHHFPKYIIFDNQV